MVINYTSINVAAQQGHWKVMPNLRWQNLHETHMAPALAVQ